MRSTKCYAFYVLHCIVEVNFLFSIGISSSISEFRYEHFQFMSLGLSQAEQASQGIRGDQFGLLGYDCLWLKWKRVRPGAIFGVLFARSRAKQLHRISQNKTSTYASICRSVLSIHSTAVWHKTLYSNTHNTAPQWQSIDASIRFQSAKMMTT